LLKDSKRFTSLDFYRFVAAFCVLLLHFTQFANYDLAVGAGGLIAGFALFVDFFFILSGFVIGVSYFDKVASPRLIFTFLRRRIARIYPLHALTLVLYLLPAVAGITQNPAKYDLSNILAQALLYQSWALNSPLPLNFPAWSISVEWGMYLLFPILVWITKTFRLVALIVVIIVGFAAVESVLRFELVKPALWFNDISLIRALPTFAIGVLISRTYFRFDIPLGTIVGFVALIASLATIMAHTTPYLTIALFSVSVFATASGNRSEYRIFDGAFSRMLGDASYGVYMIHSITLTVLVQLLWPRLSSDVPPFWFGVLGGVLTTIAALISYRFFEKPAKELITGAHRSEILAT
jgi:peptidoglycan/LPS O-acetylase OafA/YrhL